MYRLFVARKYFNQVLNLILILAHQVDSDVLSPLVEVFPIALLIVSLCRLLIEKLVEIAILCSIAGAVLFLRGGPLACQHVALREIGRPIARFQAVARGPGVIELNFDLILVKTTCIDAEFES